MIIYLDESGDLGFDWAKSGTSFYFVITLLVFDSIEIQKHFKCAVKRTLKKINHKNKKIMVHELKGSMTSFQMKAFFFNQLPSNGWIIYSVTLNKRKLDERLIISTEKTQLYNFLVSFLLQKISFSTNLTYVNLIVDKCKNRNEIKSFNSYLSFQLKEILPLKIPLNINHLASHKNAGLQAVDMFCWGIARKINFKDCKWYDLFQEKIKCEIDFLKKEDGPSNISYL